MSRRDQLEAISRVFNTNPVDHDWASRREGVVFTPTSSYIFYRSRPLGSTESRLLLVVESNVFHQDRVWERGAVYGTVVSLEMNFRTFTLC